MKHERERTSGDYDILQKAKELAIYTIRITSNERNFPKRYRFTVTEKIINKSLFILDSLMMAYEIYPNDRIEFEKRILYEKEARAACRSLLTMMEVAANAFDIKAGTFEHWTERAVDLRQHITGWIKSDVNRFKWGTDYK